MKMKIIVHIIQRIRYVFLYLNCSILMNDQKVLKVIVKHSLHFGKHEV